jgi:8-oxo-dGTP pyrophosphatase MutT (NUDIX family)
VVRKMPRYERSAGVVIFKITARGRFYLLLDYGRFWDFPKGHVEKDEEEVEAAIRELEEETGITKFKLIEDFRREIEYFFRDKDGYLVRKSVVFFLAQVKAPKVRISDEHSGFEFLPFDAALRRVKYPTAKEVLKAAEDFLNSLPIATKSAR